MSPQYRPVAGWLRIFHVNEKIQTQRKRHLKERIVRRAGTVRGERRVGNCSFKLDRNEEKVRGMAVKDILSYCRPFK